MVLSPFYSLVLQACRVFEARWDSWVIAVSGASVLLCEVLDSLDGRTLRAMAENRCSVWLMSMTTASLHCQCCCWRLAGGERTFLPLSAPDWDKFKAAVRRSNTPALKSSICALWQGLKCSGGLLVLALILPWKAAKFWPLISLICLLINSISILCDAGS